MTVLTSPLEAVARELCIVDGVDPDLETIGLGRWMPEGKRYKLWEARIRHAEAVLKLLNRK